MLRKIWGRGWISLGVMVLILALMIVPAANVYDTDLYSAEVKEVDEDGNVLIVLNGINLLRVNSFYLNGKRVDDCTVLRSTYGECSVVVKRELLDEAGEWIRIEMGFSKWGIINLRSSSLWLEWQTP